MASSDMTDAVDDEARFRAFVAASSDVVYRMSPDWSQMRQLEGRAFLADTHAPDTGWLDRYIHPDDQARVRAAIAPAIRDKAVFDLEHRVIRADGSLGWTHSRAVPLLDAAGEIREWVGAARDVTAVREAADARAEAEARLRESETLRRVAVAAGRMGSWRWDLARRQVWGDAQFMALWGFPPTDDPLPLERFTERQSRAGVAQTEGVVGKAVAAGEEFDATVEIASGPTAGCWLRWRGRPSEDDTSVLYGVSFDITEQKHAETRLQDSERQLRAVLDQAPIAIVFTGRSGDIVFRNAMFDVLWGRRPHDTTARTYSDVYEGFYPDGRPVPSEAWPGARAVRGGETVHGEVLEIVDAEGQHVPCSFDAGPIRDDEGHVVGGVVMFRDVTAEVAAQQALRESESRHSAIYAQAAAGFAETATDGGFIRVNPEYCRIVGRSREELLGGLTMQAITHPDDRPSNRDRFINAVRDGAPFEVRKRYIRPDGSEVWVHNSVAAIRGADGRIASMHATSIDVSRAMQAEIALRESEARLQTLVAGVPQLVWRATGDGDWTWASPQWTAYTAQAEADSHGRGWLDPVHPDDRERVADAWAHAVERGEFQADYRIRHAETQRYRWFQTRATPVRNAAGEIVEWLGTSTDVEDLRALQDRQRVLLFELQHRVRNTLAVIRSLSHSTAETSDTVEDFTAHFEGRLSALARTQMVLTRAPGAGVDLETMVREELLAQAPGLTQIKVEGPGVLLSAKAAEVLALAVHELATNAVKYGALSAPQGRIAVRWDTAEERGEQWLRLHWEESGVRVVARAPRREGFGAELVTQRVPYELRGRGSLDLRPGGLRAEIAFPMRPGESILQTDAPGG